MRRPQTLLFNLCVASRQQRHRIDLTPDERHRSLELLVLLVLPELVLLKGSPSSQLYSHPPGLSFALAPFSSLQACQEKTDQVLPSTACTFSHEGSEGMPSLPCSAESVVWCRAESFLNFDHTQRECEEFLRPRDSQSVPEPQNIPELVQ